MQQTDIGFIYFGIIKMNIYFDYGGGEMMNIHLYITPFFMFVFRLSIQVDVTGLVPYS